MRLGEIASTFKRKIGIHCQYTGFDCAKFPFLPGYFTFENIDTISCHFFPARLNVLNHNKGAIFVYQVLDYRTYKRTLCNKMIGVTHFFCLYYLANIPICEFYLRDAFG